MTDQKWQEDILKNEVAKAIERTAEKVAIGEEQHQRQQRIAELTAQNEQIGLHAIELQSALRPQDKTGAKKVAQLHKQIEANEQEIARLTPKERDTSGGYTGSLRK